MVRDEVKRKFGSDIISSFQHELTELIKTRKKELYRTDQMFKRVIRRLARHEKDRFQAFRKEHCTEKPTKDQNSRLLKTYLEQKIQIKLSPQDLLFAKKVYYSIPMKMMEDELGGVGNERLRRLKDPFLRRGTLRAGVNFFTEKVGFFIFFLQFTQLMEYALSIDGLKGMPRLRKTVTHLLKELINRPFFKEELKRSMDEGQTYPDLVVEVCHPLI